MFDFREQLKKGQDAEAELLASYHRPVLKYDGREFDLIDNKANRIEVKTEFRTLDATKNFFIEVSGNVERGKPGGPWQAALNGATHFVIYHPLDAVYFLCSDIPALCQAVTDWAGQSGAKLKLIRNKGWTGSGYAVPRDRLSRHFQGYHIPPGGRAAPFDAEAFLALGGDKTVRSDT